MSDSHYTLQDYTTAALKARSLPDLTPAQEECVVAGAAEMAMSQLYFKAVQVGEEELGLLPVHVALALPSRRVPSKSLRYPQRFFADVVTRTREWYKQRGLLCGDEDLRKVWSAIIRALPDFDPMRMLSMFCCALFRALVFEGDQGALPTPTLLITKVLKRPYLKTLPHMEL